MIFENNLGRMDVEVCYTLGAGLGDGAGGGEGGGVGVN